MGIPKGPQRSTLLALQLARKHEPGFKPKRQDGRPAKWDAIAKLVLANLVAIAMHPFGWTKAHACEYLARYCPWLSGMEGRPDGDALARQCSAHMLKIARNDLAAALGAGMFEEHVACIRAARDVLKG
jgi:hypothetical protein